MTVHLVKLCVGADSVADQAAWVRKRAAANNQAGRGRIHDHVTRMHPRREDDLVDGGSLYWVIKGAILARQPIIGFERRLGPDGIERTAIFLKPALILTDPQPRRAFQGWRYLSAVDAPRDLKGRSASGPPPELGAELAALGLL